MGIMPKYHILDYDLYSVKITCLYVAEKFCVFVLVKRETEQGNEVILDGLEHVLHGNRFIPVKWLFYNVLRS